MGLGLPLDIKPSDITAEKVLNISRKKYSTAREEVDKYLEEIFSSGRKYKKKVNKQESLIDFPVSVRDKYKRKSI